MKKIILLGVLTFVSGCSFFSGSRSTASDKETCIKLSPESGFNMQNVCVGEESYITKTKTNGKIVEIDISGMEDDKAETIFFLVEDKAGHKIRMTGKDIVLNKKGLCIKSRDGESLCVGDKFHALADGNRRSILGFSMSTAADQYINIYTMGVKDTLLRKESPWDAFASVKASYTGMISGYGSCKEELLMKTDSALIKCAKKDLIKKMDTVCDNFRHGSGRVVADIETKSIKSSCSKEYSMFGTSTKTCSAELSAKCEKTKKVEGWVLQSEDDEDDI